MNSATLPSASVGSSWVLPSRGRVGMICLIAAEAAIFTIFVVAYLFYSGKSISGPTPRDVLQPPLFLSACLLASSLTIHLAVKALGQGSVLRFNQWWFVTLLLGLTFLAGTAREWRRLIVHDGLTISTNLFGTTYFSLVGLHAFHVAAGLLIMTVTACCAMASAVKPVHAERLDVFALYWHFVDCVWVVVFFVVYVVGR
jgi:cytochrome c oxidase subunit III